MKEKTPTLLRLARLAGRSAVKAGADKNALPPGAMERVAAGRRAVNPFNMTFLKALTRQTPSGCWEWIGTKCTDGYGMAVFYGKRWGTHRASWFINFGQIPDDKMVLHKCDNPPCINPDHLYLGNHRRNALDAVQRDRKPDVKLTPKEAQQIEVEYLRGSESQRAVGERHGVSQSLVSRIVSGFTWNHTKDQPNEL